MEANRCSALRKLWRISSLALFASGLLLADVMNGRAQETDAPARDGSSDGTGDVEQLQRDVQALKAELAAVSDEARSAEEWRESTSAFHLAGYAAAGYTNEEDQTGAFDLVTFNPIFHFQYRDRVLWEAELEMEIERDGETNVNLEYSAVDFLINDYLLLSGGKFLSPLGQFRQNMHPAWINKLPSAPPGFGHDGAAPESDVGLQLRGGVPIGTARMSYAAYVGNGPELEAEDGEIEGIAAEGFTRDSDGKKVWGGRVGFLPSPHLELGLSAATGKTSVATDDGIELAGDPLRDYDVLGVDMDYHWTNAELRGEYIRQSIGEAPGSVAPEGGEWTAWFVQGSYKFAGNDWEGVARYGSFDSPHDGQQQTQWAIGLNYLFSPSAMVKLAYEFNDNDVGNAVGNDRWLVQIAYGY